MGDQVAVTFAGLAAFELLSATAEGTVLAVFTRTLYLQVAGALDNTIDRPLNGEVPVNTQPQLCCIGLDDMVRGPLNIGTSLKHLPAIKTGSRWYCNNLKLIVGNTELNLADAPVWSPPRVNHPSQPADTSLALLSGYLTNNKPVTVGINAMVEKQLNKAADQLQQWHYQKPTDKAAISFPTSIIGCGDGLTPAGDDILVGALLASHAWHLPQLDALIHLVRQHLDATNDISAAHLLAAANGMGIEPLHQLIYLLGRGTTRAREAADTKQILDAAKSLNNYGHSSGHYAIKGVLLSARPIITATRLCP